MKDNHQMRNYARENRIPIPKPSISKVKKETFAAQYSSPGQEKNQCIECLVRYDENKELGYIVCAPPSFKPA